MTDSKKDYKNAKQKDSQNQEENIFRDFIKSMEGFKALDNTKHNHFETKPDNYTVNTNHHNNTYDDTDDSQSDLNLTHGFKLSEHIWRPEVSAEEQLFYFQSGVQYRMIRKLRSGKIRVEASLDLHQLNKEKARVYFSNFIVDCYEQEKRCVCIIHGKGYRSSSNTPILKNLVNHWLQDINIVLGFCSCPNNMGGTGAVLVLLQRSK